ncbi:MAG: 50S ribosomal protein L15 [Chlamydiia bacterium]
MTNVYEQFEGLSHKRRMRVGRGIGSGKGKTCGRGVKGAGSRSGYTRRYGNEGGQGALFKKLPIRGFSNARHAKKVLIFNLEMIDSLLGDEKVFNKDLLRKRGIVRSINEHFQIKILGNGEIKSATRIEANAFSRSALEFLEKNQIEYKIV